MDSLYPDNQDTQHSERPAIHAPTPNRRTGICLTLLIAFLIFIIYAQVHEFAFLSYDDPIYTTNNAVVKKGLTWSGVIWAFTEGTYHSNYWAPLTWLTFLVDSELYGLNAGGYHVTNVILHVLNSVLLFAAFTRLTGNLWPSFFLAVFFAIHPLHIESVAWISERKDLVYTFFWMLTLIAYERYVRRPGLISYSLVFVMFVFCLMGKPMGLTLPFVLLLLDYWPLSRCRLGQSRHFSLNQVRPWQLVWEKLPLFVLVLLIIPLTIYTQGRAGALKPLAEIPLLFRLENVCVAYASQIFKTFYPLGLGILYPYPESLPLWKPVVAGLLLAMITALAIRYIRSKPYLAVGWLWYLGTFFPVAGVFVIGPHVTADRYTYIPLIGFFIVAIWGVVDLGKLVGYSPKKMLLGGLGLIVAFTWIAYQQVARWKNDVTIYTRTLEVTDKNWPVHLNLGSVYMENGQPGLALEHFRLAQQIKPEIAEIQLSLGNALSELGRHREVADHLAQAVLLIPGSAALHSAYAVALDRNGAMEQAIIQFRRAIEINPAFEDAYHGLGVVFNRKGLVDQAQAYYLKTLDLDPNHAAAHSNLGMAFLARGKRELARVHFEAALSSDPDFAEPYYGLGLLNLKIGRKQAATHHFKKALQIDPNHRLARKGLQNAAEY